MTLNLTDGYDDCSILFYSDICYIFLFICGVFYVLYRIIFSNMINTNFENKIFLQYELSSDCAQLVGMLRRRCLDDET